MEGAGLCLWTVLKIIKNYRKSRHILVDLKMVRRMTPPQSQRIGILKIEEASKYFWLSKILGRSLHPPFPLKKNNATCLYNVSLHDQKLNDKGKNYVYQIVVNAFDDTSSLVTSISDWLVHIHSTTCTLINIYLLLYGEIK